MNKIKKRAKPGRQVLACDRSGENYRNTCLYSNWLAFRFYLIRYQFS